MVGRCRPYESDQVVLLPAKPQGCLPAGRLAQFINDTVDALDLEAFGARHEGGGSRNQPFHPAMVVRVLVRAYETGGFSSHKVERRLHEDLAFRMMAAGNLPRDRGICDFRSSHLKELPEPFVQVVRPTREKDLVKLRRVAVDGTKPKRAPRHRGICLAGREEGGRKAACSALDVWCACRVIATRALPDPCRCGCSRSPIPTSRIWRWSPAARCGTTTATINPTGTRPADGGSAR